MTTHFQQRILRQVLRQPPASLRCLIPVWLCPSIITLRSGYNTAPFIYYIWISPRSRCPPFSVAAIYGGAPAAAPVVWSARHSRRGLCPLSTTSPAHQPHDIKPTAILMNLYGTQNIRGAVNRAASLLIGIGAVLIHLQTSPSGSIGDASSGGRHVFHRQIL